MPPLNAPTTGNVTPCVQRALMCVEEIATELLGVHASPEQLYGRLALVHRTLADATETHRERSAQHRLAHMVDGVFAGHHGVAPG